MASLHFRDGDAQSLKALISATSPLNLIRREERENGQAVLLLRLPSGVEITEPNAIAEALMEAPPTAPQLYSKAHQWLEWEREILRPAVYTEKGHQDLPNALRTLDDAVKGSEAKFLISDVPSLADISIYSTLYPVKDTAMPANVIAYFHKLCEQDSFQQAIQKMLGGFDSDVVQRVWQSDIQHHTKIQPKLPVPGERNVLITSALPYVNNVPHLGNIIGCVLSADCYARYCRARGYNTIFICGTDEYGTATETKAYEEGVSCEEICDKYYAIHKAIYDWFEISCDKFGRTPTRHQTKLCQEIFQSLAARGNVVENEMQQLFSEALGKFLADRFIVGTCPKCGYEDARGDQCDRCGALLNPTELINPRCKFTETTPVMKSTKHVFLDLPKLSESLQSYVEETSKQGGWSSNCLQITNAWIRDGLKQRCITRDLKWGVPVPMSGYENKVFYVWFDAPIGYISITANYTSEWEKWWKNPDEVELVQFMGKDNVPFHTVIFPAVLIGTGEKWTMMKKISVTEYLNYETGKFSKSRGTGVFGDNARDSGIPVEIWRYYLLSNRPETQDTTFAWDNLGAQSSELLNNLGNFINRALKFVEKFYGSRVPDSVPSMMEECDAFGAQLLTKVQSYVEKMEAIQMKAALATVMDIAATGNKFLQDHKPWQLFKQNPEKCQNVVRAAAGLVKILAALLQPFMPSISKKVLHQLDIDWEAGIRLTAAAIESIASPCDVLPSGHQIHEPMPLFSKIPEEQLQQFREKFKGQEESVDKSAAKKKGLKRGATGEKKDKNQGAETAPSAKKAADVGIHRLDLRVGFIQKVKKHPDADTLYVLEVDVGEESCRTIVSGLVKFIPENDLQQRSVVVVCNMKPVKMRGIKSEAMVLAASSSDQQSVELLQPSEGAVCGEKIFVSGYEGEADAVLNPKKIFEGVQADLKTNTECIACYKSSPLQSSTGLCTVKSIREGRID